ncbi:RnfABCDGE type electron transport complex subunit D [Leptotrichia wadei]|uniref:RnfABCDGE type electron transport complex subunit D n=1 Tax=Leptotrichia wadei TaxID=157687 RepID=UPI0028EEDC37|nr:RnfABCDGE type electron transport complex subunit D [Leptotrichia wadei]
MKNNEKSLMEEILDRKKNNGKNGLLDNDDTLLDSTVHYLPKAKKTEQLKKNHSQDSEISRTNSKIKNSSNLNTTEKIKEKEKKKETELLKKDKIDIKKIFSKKEALESDEKIKRKKIIKNFFKKRKLQKLSFTPYIRTETEVRNIMKDVIIALFPAIIASALVYGTRTLLLIAFSVLSAVVTEKLFSKYFLNDNNSVHDLSAVITGILLAMTLAPLTPLPIVIFGACMAVIFGKLIYGGIGKNIFNPAVVGREFMTVFFSSAMSSGTIWFSQELLQSSGIKFFTGFNNSMFSNYLDGLLLTPSGSVGSYSAFALILGGLYLLLKNRISWHIPVSLFVTFFLVTIFLKSNVSTGGLLLTGIFMATDMPTSPSSAPGKIYYGIMLGLVIGLLSIFGIKNEILSYVLLILNPFARIINKVFRPAVFGYVVKEEMLKNSGKMILLTLGIFAFTIIFAGIHKIGAMPYLVYLYILISTLNLISSKNKIIHKNLKNAI